MGSDLPGQQGEGAPKFLVAALKDPLSGNLDRIQIVKGWLDKRETGRRRYSMWPGLTTASPAAMASCRPWAIR